MPMPMRHPLFAASLLLCTAAGAVDVVPSSYDVRNGNSSAFHYWDDLYTGAGCKTCDGAQLTGGLGDLTDGVVAGSNWNVAPSPYVGWLGFNPSIDFHFSGVVSIDSVTLSLDDSQLGGVVAPAGAIVNGQLYNIVNPPGSAPFNYSISGLNFTGSNLNVTIVRNGDWVFASEVRFQSPVPEPASAGLLVAGLFVLGLARQRRADLAG